MKRIGVIGIVVTGDRRISGEVQNILSDYGDIIIGRMGVPVREHSVYTMSIIVMGENETISALTGKLGRLSSVNVKSALTAIEIKE